MEAPPYATRRAQVHRLPGGATEDDRLAVEEPLEIRVCGRAVAVTMRTPVIDVDAPGADFDRVQRSFYTSSSCGICGKGALEAVAVEAPRIESRVTVAFDVVAALPGRLREAQATFALTGGLHATGLFTPDGELRCLRVDVGRHNALDKVLGWALGEGLVPLADSILCVSGRLSFELVQKASVAGCPVLVAVGAPSSLAVELADDRGVTLLGFVRDGRGTVYTGRQRIVA